MMQTAEQLGRLFFSRKRKSILVPLKLQIVARVNLVGRVRKRRRELESCSKKCHPVAVPNGQIKLKKEKDKRSRTRQLSLFAETIC